MGIRDRQNFDGRPAIGAPGSVVVHSAPMITIKITNVEDVVQKQKGWFVANVVGAFVDLESRVENIVIEKLRDALAAEGIVATIERRDT